MIVKSYQLGLCNSPLVLKLSDINSDIVWAFYSKTTALIELPFISVTSLYFFMGKATRIRLAK